MKHICIVGGGAALAQPLIQKWIKDPEVWITAVCRTTRPFITDTQSDFMSVVTTYKDISDKPIELAVLLPGAFDNARIDKMRMTQWEAVIDDTLTATFNGLHHLLPKMNNGGNVVVVGSIVGSTGGYGCANYAAAKAGLVGLVRGAANEHRNLHINLLELGYIDAGMGKLIDKSKVLPSIPLGRFGTEEDFVHAVEFLSTTKYMTGNVLTLAGGMR